MRTAEKIRQIRQKAVRLDGFELSAIEPCAPTRWARIHHDMLVSLAPNLVHGNVACGAVERHLLRGFGRYVPELDEDVVVLNLDFIEVFRGDERAFTSCTIVHFLEDRVFDKAAANQGCETTGTVHGHGGTLDPEHRWLSRGWG